MNTHITSLQNPLVKSIIKLQDKSRERRKTGLFIVEGVREIGLAIAGGYTIDRFIFSPHIFDATSLIDTFGNNIDYNSINQISVADDVYKKIAYRDSTEGLIAIVKSKSNPLSSLVFEKDNPLILVAEAPEKPGNIGAILRTADAANVDAVIIANPKTDLYNPNIIRSSVGGIFTNQIAMGSTEEIVRYLKEQNIQIFTAALTEKAEPYSTQDYTRACALVVGTEATGLSETWLNNAHKSIIIPMRGVLDSMNVSVATGILIFEAIRQREQMI
jgi:TrmH family RNA methyltransferase